MGIGNWQSGANGDGRRRRNFCLCSVDKCLGFMERTRLSYLLSSDLVMMLVVAPVLRLSDGWSHLNLPPSLSAGPVLIPVRHMREAAAHAPRARGSPAEAQRRPSLLVRHLRRLLPAQTLPGAAPAQAHRYVAGVTEVCWPLGEASTGIGASWVSAAARRSMYTFGDRWGIAWM